ncbi:MAG: RNA methyltransferase [Candidatus Obscuribacterales bacterium]|nr:RNA methyltransferase [Candidatus Obscuribacterales bacterium]
MQTYCPNPDCGKLLDLDIETMDKRSHFQGICPHCLVPASFRSQEALAAIEKEYGKKLSTGNLKGGPELPEDVRPSLCVLVEDVRSLWNVGSIFRTADGAGFQAIYLSGITGSPPRKEIAKVSLGAEDTVPWQYHANPLAVIKDLSARGILIVGLEVSQSSVLLSQALETDLLSTPLCLVVGNEVSGLSPQVMHFCDRTCHLPMAGMKESLNVAVAFGVAAYALSGKFLSP